MLTSNTHQIDDDGGNGKANHAIDKSLATISLTLCHIQELIGLAYQLSCELHPSDEAAAILRTGGRLATLMHVSAQQLTAVQTETDALLEAQKLQ